MALIDLTESELRAIYRAAGDGSPKLRAKIEAVLGAPPVKCPHTRSKTACGSFESEAALVAHMIVVHRYVDDEYGEDTAQSNAWRAWHHPSF